MVRYGLLVKRDNSCFARRDLGFDSLTVHQGYGALAQLGERNAGSVEVEGSNPSSSTITSGSIGKTVGPGHNSLVKYETQVAKCFISYLISAE